MGSVVTRDDAAAAADALAVVDRTLAVRDVGRVVRADARAGAAADAEVLLDVGLAGRMHFHLARAAAAAHAEVLERAAEADLLVALEVGERDNDVGVHDGAADLGFLHIFSALDGHLFFVEPLEAVGDQHMAARGQRREAVEIGGVEMVKRIFSAADIECVAVSQKRFAAARLDHVHDGFGVIRAQEREIAELAEVDLDGDKFAVEINLVEAGCQNQLFQLLLLVEAGMAAKIGKVYFGRFHMVASPLCMCGAQLRCRIQSV